MTLHHASSVDYLLGIVEILFLAVAAVLLGLVAWVLGRAALHRRRPPS